MAGRSPFIMLGIGGGAGCGKTTLAKAIQAQLKDDAEVISIDSYFRNFESLNEEELEATNFDEPSAYLLDELRTDLLNLKEGREVWVPVYDFKKSLRTGSRLIRRKAFLIVEGLFALHDAELRDMFDLRVYVEASEARRIQRQLDRLNAERGGCIASRMRRIRKFVLPMHSTFIEPSRKWADIRVRNEGSDHAEIHSAARSIIESLRIAC